MRRHLQISRQAFAVASFALASAACSSPEEEVLTRFFTATERDDNSTVAALSMVAFPEDLTAWQVEEIVATPNEPYPIPALRQRVRDVEEERDAQFKIFGRFREENYDDLGRIQRRLRDNPETQFSGRLGELKEEYDAFRAERRDVVAKLHEAEEVYELALRTVNKSLQRETSPEYLTGETEHREARVRVTTETGEKTYNVLLTRYQLVNQFDAAVPARWIIQRITEG